MSSIRLKIPYSKSRSQSKGQIHTHVSMITLKLLKQIYEKAYSLNELDCFFLCQGNYRWSASRGDGAFRGLCYTLSQFLFLNLKNNNKKKIIIKLKQKIKKNKNKIIIIS